MVQYLLFNFGHYRLHFVQSVLAVSFIGGCEMGRLRVCVCQCLAQCVYVVFVSVFLMFTSFG